MTPIQDLCSTELHRRFLLGDLSEHEQDRLEERLLEDSDLFEQVEAAEDELIDRYVRSELDAHERDQFEQRLLISRRVRNRVITARSLQHLAAGNGSATHEAESPRTEGTGLGRLLPLGLDSGGGGRGGRTTSSSQWLAWAACLVSLVAAGVLALISLQLQDRLNRVQQAHEGAIERVLSADERAEEMSAALERARSHEAEAERLRHQLAEREERIAALEERTEPQLRTTPTGSVGGAESAEADRPIGRIVLFLSQISRGEPDELQLPEQARPVELQLDLGRDRPEGRLTVTVSRSGVPVWRQTGLDPVYAGPEAMVSLTIPADSLFPGTYDIEVLEQDTAGSEVLGRYSVFARR